MRIFLAGLLFSVAFSAAAQEYPAIGAENVAKLRPVNLLNFPIFSDEMSIGWFETNEDARKFTVFDAAGNVFGIRRSGAADWWTYRERDDQIFLMIDAVYLQEYAYHAYQLYLLDDAFFINEQRLESDYTPVRLHAFDGSLFVEATDEGGATIFQEFRFDDESRDLRLARTVTFPEANRDLPAVRIGRIDFPLVIMSDLSEGGLTVYRFPDAFTAEGGRSYDLDGGPAVFGAVNATSSHFAWSDPYSERLNLLDLETGENRMVAEIGGAYAQYHLLTADASAILIVNLDFEPEVYAWDVDTGERYELGPYRLCERIPDKVALSRDGTALVIGCDTGLEIWRVINNDHSEEG